MDAHVPVPTIMALGRWRSLAWHAYAMQSVEDLRQAQTDMWCPTTDTVVTTVRVGDHHPATVFADHDLPVI